MRLPPRASSTFAVAIYWAPFKPYLPPLTRRRRGKLHCVTGETAHEGKKQPRLWRGRLTLHRRISREICEACGVPRRRRTLDGGGHGRSLSGGRARRCNASTWISDRKTGLYRNFVN